MKKSLLVVLILCGVVLAGCFHKKNPTPIDINTGSTNTGVVDNDDFDPSNFEDPEVKEVFDLLEELVAEDETGDVQAEEIEADTGSQQ